MHAADETPSKNAATRDMYCNFMHQGGGGSQCSSRIDVERNETSGGRHNWGAIRRKRCKQHRRCMVSPKARLEEVIAGKCNGQLASRAQIARAFKQQVFDVAPPVFPVCVSPRSRPKIRT